MQAWEQGDLESAETHIAESAAILRLISYSPDAYLDYTISKTAAALEDAATTATLGDRDALTEKTMEADRHSLLLRTLFS